MFWISVSKSVVTSFLLRVFFPAFLGAGGRTTEPGEVVFESCGVFLWVGLENGHGNRAMSHSEAASHPKIYLGKTKKLQGTTLPKTNSSPLKKGLLLEKKTRTRNPQSKKHQDDRMSSLVW